MVTEMWDDLRMGRPRKQPIVEETTLPTIPSDIDRFTASVSRVQDEVQELFPDTLFQTIKKIAYEVSVVGLTEQEACMISDYPHETFIELKQKYPIVARLMELKDLEYKRTLLKSISTKAGTDDKLAMWLLEAKYPTEFNRRKGAGNGSGENGENLVAAAVEFVRKSGDKDGLVSETSGRAFLIRTKQGEEAKSVQQILD